MKKLILKMMSIELVLKVVILFLLITVSWVVQSQDEKGRVNLPGRIAVDSDSKGQVGSLNSTTLLTLGNTWQVTECCGWTGTWTRRPNTNTFDASWRHTNGTSAVDVIQLKSWDTSTNEVTLYRQSMNGSYKAKYNPNSKTFTNGTTTWYPAGQVWSAVIIR
jgi:hypothetical protein